MPRRFASATSSKRSTLPPPDFGFISSTALRVPCGRGRLAGGAVAADCRRLDSRIAVRVAQAKTRPATTKITSSSTAPRAIIATAAPTRAATATTAATGRIAPRRVTAVQPAAAATASAASTISSVTQFLTTSTTSAATTAATASSASHAARRPVRRPAVVRSRALTAQPSCQGPGRASHVEDDRSREAVLAGHPQNRVAWRLSASREGRMSQRPRDYSRRWWRSCGNGCRRCPGCGSSRRIRWAGSGAISSPGWSWRRCSCRREWPTRSSRGCRRSPVSTRRSSASPGTRSSGRRGSSCWGRTRRSAR